MERSAEQAAWPCWKVVHAGFSPRLLRRAGELLLLVTYRNVGGPPTRKDVTHDPVLCYRCSASQSQTLELRFLPGAWRAFVVRLPPSLFLTSLKHSGLVCLKVLCFYHLKHSLCVLVSKQVYTDEVPDVSTFPLYT